MKVLKLINPTGSFSLHHVIILVCDNIFLFCDIFSFFCDRCTCVTIM